MTSQMWNPWHGCVKYSEGCRNCYVYRRDESVGRDAAQISRTKAFDLPVKLKRDGTFKLPPGSSVFACMTSDFFLEEADGWREEIWQMIRLRRDVQFSIITKRILRARDCLPPDWGEGYPHVSIGCTMENQTQCENRRDAFMELPAAGRFIICEPLLGPVDLRGCLGRGISSVTVGGESGPRARVCDFDWVLDIQRQCVEANVPFHFRQTGARLRKDGRVYTIPRKSQYEQARRAGIDYLYG